MNQFDDRNSGFMQMFARFLLNIKASGDGLARTTPIFLRMINAPPVDLVDSRPVLGVLIALSVQQHGIAFIAFDEASLFKTLSIKNCKITMGTIHLFSFSNCFNLLFDGTIGTFGSCLCSAFLVISKPLVTALPGQVPLLLP